LLNYPTFAAYKWLKRSPHAADNWSLIFDAYDRGELSAAMLKQRYRGYLLGGLSPQRDLLAYRLLLWFTDAACWEQIHEDLLATLNAGSGRVKYSYSEQIRLDELAARAQLQRQQRFNVLQRADRFTNVPTGICAWWLLEHTNTAPRLAAVGSLDLQAELVKDVLESAVGHAQARSQQSALLLNWLLGLVLHHEVCEFLTRHSGAETLPETPHELATYQVTPEPEKRRGGILGFLYSLFA
jgi:hypothetical protein